jgi:hypothetical protein
VPTFVTRLSTTQTLQLARAIFQQDGEILAFLGRNDVCGDSHWKETKVIFPLEGKQRKIPTRRKQGQIEMKTM